MKEFDSNVRRILPSSVDTIVSNIEKEAWNWTFRRLNYISFLISHWLCDCGQVMSPFEISQFPPLYYVIDNFWMQTFRNLRAWYCVFVYSLKRCVHVATELYHIKRYRIKYQPMKCRFILYAVHVCIEKGERSVWSKEYQDLEGKKLIKKPE